MRKIILILSILSFGFNFPTVYVKSFKSWFKECSGLQCRIYTKAVIEVSNTLDEYNDINLTCRYYLNGDDAGTSLIVVSPRGRETIQVESNFIFRVEPEDFSFIQVGCFLE
jgi:hypothetical protein